jgi:hypothetical protein
MEHDVRLRVEKRAYDEATRDTKRTYDELVRAKKNVKETKVTPTPEVGEKEGKTDGVENS